MANKYKGIVFDLDGVICSTDQYHYKAWKKLADKLGLAFDEQKNNRLRGVSRMESLDIVLENSPEIFSQKEKDQFASEKNEEYKILLQQMSKSDLPEDVKLTLDKLRKEGVLLAIGSSSKNTKFILRQIGLENFFDAVADGNDITHSKPDPEVFLLAAQKIGQAPTECLVVEDAKAGIDAAVAGGFDSAAIGDAATYGKATYHLQKISDILTL